MCCKHPLAADQRRRRLTLHLDHSSVGVAAERSARTLDLTTTACLTPSASPTPDTRLCLLEAGACHLSTFRSLHACCHNPLLRNDTVREPCNAPHAICVKAWDRRTGMRMLANHRPCCGFRIAISFGRITAEAIKGNPTNGRTVVVAVSNIRM